MTATVITPKAFAALETRFNTLDRRVTKMETAMTTITPYLATKADIKEAIGEMERGLNSHLRWMIGLFVGSFIGLSALFYTSQTRMETRLERSMDQRFEQVERRFEQVDQRFDQIDRRLDRVEHRLDRVETRLERVEQAVFTPAASRQTR